MLTFILTKKEIGAELLKDYHLAGIECELEFIIFFNFL